MGFYILKRFKISQHSLVGKEKHKKKEEEGDERTEGVYGPDNADQTMKEMNSKSHNNNNNNNNKPRRTGTRKWRTVSRVGV